MRQTDIKSINKEQLNILLMEMGEPAFRAEQIYQWLHKRLVRNFDEMTNIKKELREKCKERFIFTSLKPIKIQTSNVDGTKKFLFELADGNVVESVLMKYKHGNSVCISSQVGCRMGCQFCASTLDGLERNLTPAEMLDQIYAIIVNTGERVANVVVMGTGEPLDNYDNLLVFIKILTDENGLNLSQRNITVSTCGMVPQIKQLSEERLQITLALSLHAVTDEKRMKIMPIAKRYTIEELIEACQYYFKMTGRRITFEYSMAAGINDTSEDAKGLAKLAGRVRAHVNLIPVNPIKERDFKQPAVVSVERFKNKLEKNHINVTIRREMGRDIDGACGQLRRRHKEEKEVAE